MLWWLTAGVLPLFFFSSFYLPIYPSALQRFFHRHPLRVTTNPARHLIQALMTSIKPSTAPRSTPRFSRLSWHSLILFLLLRTPHNGADAIKLVPRLNIRHYPSSRRLGIYIPSLPLSAFPDLRTSAPCLVCLSNVLFSLLICTLAIVLITVLPQPFLLVPLPYFFLWKYYPHSFSRSALFLYTTFSYI
jgi:hypothetical protein